MAADQRSPLEEDTAAHRVAERLGFELVRRYRRIEILDEKAVAEAGYVTKKPKLDFGKIAQALENGETVEGARLHGVEYVLRGVR